MAKIKLSSIGITNISGKAGGTIYANNKGGAYMKNFAVPSNPRSTLQQERRSTFGSLSSMWRSLTEGERNAWEAASQDFPRRNHFGDVYYLSGNSLFQGFNSNLALIGLNAKTSAPIKEEIQHLEDLSLTSEFSGTPVAYSLTIGMTFGPESPTNTTYAVFVSPPLSAGISNAKKRMRFLTTITAGVGGNTLNITTAYTAKFGTPAEGAKIFCEIKAIDKNNGSSGQDATFSDITETV